MMKEGPSSPDIPCLFKLTETTVVTTTMIILMTIRVMVHGSFLVSSMSSNFCFKYLSVILSVCDMGFDGMTTNFSIWIVLDSRETHKTLDT